MRSSDVVNNRGWSPRDDLFDQEGGLLNVSVSSLFSLFLPHRPSRTTLPVGPDEAEALLAVEPLNGGDLHGCPFRDTSSHARNDAEIKFSVRVRNLARCRNFYFDEIAGRAERYLTH